MQQEGAVDARHRTRTRASRSGASRALRRRACSGTTCEPGKPRESKLVPNQIPEQPVLSLRELEPVLQKFEQEVSLVIERFPVPAAAGRPERSVGRKNFDLE